MVVHLYGGRDVRFNVVGVRLLFLFLFRNLLQAVVQIQTPMHPASDSEIHLCIVVDVAVHSKQACIKRVHALTRCCC